MCMKSAFVKIDGVVSTQNDLYPAVIFAKVEDNHTLQQGITSDSDPVSPGLMK